MGLEAATVALLVSGAAATGQAIVASEAAEEQGKIEDARAASAKARRLEERRRDFRRRRIAAAQIRQGAETAGTAGSSAVAGGLASLATGGAAFRGASRAEEQVGDIVTRARGRISSLQSISGALSAANQLAQTGALLFPRQPDAPQTTIPTG